MNARLPIALMLSLLGAAAAHSAPVSYVGPYAGGDVLLARLAPNRTDSHDFAARNDRDFGWKGMVGVRMTPRFAFEAGFTNFGDARARSITTGPARARTQAFTAFGVGFLPAGPVDVFAKAGPTRMQYTGHVRGDYFDRQDKKMGYGAGLQLAKRRLTVRAEYEKLGRGPAGRMDAVSLGFRLAFRPN